MAQIDLLSPEMLPARLRYRKWFALSVAGVAVVVGVALSARAQATVEAERGAEIVRLERKQVWLEDRRELAARECAAGHHLAGELVQLQSLAARTKRLVAQVEFAAAALPADAWLEEVSFAEMHFGFRGAAWSGEAVADFVARLSHHEGIGTVEVEAGGAGDTPVVFVVRAET